MYGNYLTDEDRILLLPAVIMKVPVCMQLMVVAVYGLSQNLVKIKLFI